MAILHLGFETSTLYYNITGIGFERSEWERETAMITENHQSAASCVNTTGYLAHKQVMSLDREMNADFLVHGFTLFHGGSQCRQPHCLSKSHTVYL